jgi:hypothetical protein
VFHAILIDPAPATDIALHPNDAAESPVEAGSLGVVGSHTKTDRPIAMRCNQHPGLTKKLSAYPMPALLRRPHPERVQLRTAVHARPPSAPKSATPLSLNHRIRSMMQS